MKGNQASTWNQDEGWIDLCHAFENLMLALCKYQKWKEKVKISDTENYGICKSF